MTETLSPGQSAQTPNTGEGPMAGKQKIVTYLWFYVQSEEAE
jgi:hypothetical protein